MKLNELKTGMVLEFDDGEITMVLRGTSRGDICSGKDTWFPLHSLNEKMEHFGVKVTHVYDPETNQDFLYKGVTTNHPCIYKRRDEERIKELEEGIAKMQEELNKLL